VIKILIESVPELVREECYVSGLPNVKYYLDKCQDRRPHNKLGFSMTVFCAAKDDPPDPPISRAFLGIDQLYQPVNGAQILRNRDRFRHQRFRLNATNDDGAAAVDHS